MEQKNENAEMQKNVLKNEERRAFLEKYGRLTAAVPAGMLLLMGPTQSRAAQSTGNDDGP
jgi:hypothetical protein